MTEPARALGGLIILAVSSWLMIVIVRWAIWWLLL